MKILFCTYNIPDYGPDNLYDGLCRLFGYENIFEYPEKPLLHGAKGSVQLRYPLFFDWPVAAGDRLKMLRNNEFDIILVSCRPTSTFGNDRVTRKEKQRDFLEALKEKSKTTPIFLIDQSDGSGINTQLISDLNPRTYFKREYLKTNSFPPLVQPLSFSYSEKYIPADINTERANTVFWAGQKYGERALYLDACEETLGSRFSGKLEQPQYSAQMLKHKIGLNLKGYGNDTVRYYETPAHATLLFSQKSDIAIENDFEDGKNAVFFGGIGEMKEKLDYCLKNESYVDKIRIAGYEHFKKYHTSAKRAEQMMDKIKSAIR